MVSDKEDKRLKLEKFEGLYAQDSMDEIPADHAQDCLNIAFTSSGHIKTRDGLAPSTTLSASGVRRFFLMETQPANDQETSTASNPNLLILDNNTSFYIDNNFLISIAGAADFAAINMGNRTYLSPNGGIGGSRLHKLKVINSMNRTVRNAGGLAPAVTSGGLLTAVESAAAGNVTGGVHKIAVIFETDTGFWTQPGPKVNITCTPAPGKPTIFTTSGAHGMISGESHTIWGGSGSWQIANDTWHITKIDDRHFSIPLDTSGLGSSGTMNIDGAFTPAIVTCTGDHKIDVGSVTLAAAGTGVVKRIILATRADENEFFFLPEKTGSQPIVPDNFTTTTTIDFEDTDLVASADYLFDLLEVIPAGAAMTKYRGRLAIVGTYFADGERAWISEIGDPETFSYVSGYVQVQSERDGNILTNCFVLRDTLYLSKFVGMFSTEDNGGNPSTWGVSVVDGAVGSYAHGTSSFTLSQPASDTGDMVIFASRSGLILFDGVVRRPELSDKIWNLWSQINPDYFWRVTIAHDPWNHILYISVPLDGSTEANKVLVAYYGEGRDPQAVRWSIWKFHKDATCIGMAFFGTDQTYTLRVGNKDTNKLWRLQSTAKNDDGNVTESYYIPGPMFIGADGSGPDTGGVNVFKQLNFRVRGNPNAKFMITLTDVDGLGAVYPPELTLNLAPRKDLQRGINFVNEKIILKVGIYAANGKTPALNDFFFLDRIDLWGRQLWNSRPTV